MEEEEIHCPHCQLDFRFGDKLGDEYEKIYANKLVYIPPIQGKPIMLGKPQIDENYIARRKLISDDDEEEKNVEIQEDNGQCFNSNQNVNLNENRINNQLLQLFQY